MNSTPSRLGGQAPDWVENCHAGDQPQNQLTHRVSKPEGTGIEDRVMHSPREDIYYPPRALENWFMLGLLYRILKSLLNLILFRRLEQSESKIPAGHQPKPLTGIHITVGDRAVDAGNVRGTGNIKITGMATGDGIAAAEHLNRLFGAPDPVVLAAGNDAQRVGNVEDFGNRTIGT